MNYLLLLVFVIIVLLILDKYIFPQNLSNISSSYESPTIDLNSGFVKPEHKLLHILNKVSSGSKLKLNGNCNQYIYNKNTISSDLNNKIIYLVKDIISSINQISKSDFYTKKIENVYVMIDSKNNQRYVVDFFIYDTTNYYTIRLISDIVIIDNEIYINYLHIQSGSNSYLLNKYDVKFNSIGILFDSNMFHEDLIKIFDNYYSNSFKVIGISDSNIEYNKEDLTSALTLNSLKNIYLPASVSSDTYDELNKKDLSGYLEMYLPENQNVIRSTSFCDKYKIKWDNYGIMNENDNDDDNCYLNNNQTSSEINQPWFGPGVIYERSSNDKYKWLKDPAIGNIIRNQGY